MTTTTTTTLQMMRADIDLREFNRWMGTRRFQDPDHAMHSLLKECLGELAPKPFRLVATRDATTGCLYGYGQADADALRESAAICACPLQARVLPADRIDTKPMPAEWRVGLRLGFEVRVRPIVRLRKDPSRVPPDMLRRFRTRPGDADAPRPGKECDVFQWKAMLLPERGMKKTREEVYVDWLGEQFERLGGASLDKDRAGLKSFRRTRAFRRLHSRHSEGPDALMRGELVVRDPAAFAALLARGLGRHRAYGYGMLLLRPAGRRG